VSLVITGYTQNVLASIAEAFHPFTFVPSVLKLPICEADASGSQLEPILSLALHLWHTNPSNRSAEGLEESRANTIR
jgi:hypothetical protein